MVRSKRLRELIATVPRDQIVTGVGRAICETKSERLAGELETVYSFLEQAWHDSLEAVTGQVRRNVPRLVPVEKALG